MASGGPNKAGHVPKVRAQKTVVCQRKYSLNFPVNIKRITPTNPGIDGCFLKILHLRIHCHDPFKAICNHADKSNMRVLFAFKILNIFSK